MGRKTKLPFSLLKRVQKTFRKTEKAKQNATIGQCKTIKESAESIYFIN